VLDFTVNGHTYVHASPEHERELVRIFESALRTLTARGGRVAMLQVPCMDENQGDNPTMMHDRNLPASVANVNQALETVARRDPKQISFVKWADAICPGGKFVAKINGITVRPDGVHYATHPGAEIATDALAPILSRLAVEAHDARARKPAAARG
jgi:hypothetical protein